MSKDQSNLPMGPDGEIPLRRNEDGEIIYMTREELWKRQTRYTPEQAVHAIGEFQKAIERLRVAAARSPADAKARPQPEPGPTAERDPEQLLTAAEVGEILDIPRDSVYELGGLTRTQLGPRRVRWKLADVRAFIEKRRETF